MTTEENTNVKLWVSYPRVAVAGCEMTVSFRMVNESDTGIAGFNIALKSQAFTENELMIECGDPIGPGEEVFPEAIITPRNPGSRPLKYRVELIGADGQKTVANGLGQGATAHRLRVLPGCDGQDEGPLLEKLQNFMDGEEIGDRSVQEVLDQIPAHDSQAVSLSWQTGGKTVQPPFPVLPPRNAPAPPPKPNRKRNGTGETFQPPLPGEESEVEEPVAAESISPPLPPPPPPRMVEDSTTEQVAPPIRPEPPTTSGIRDVYRPPIPPRQPRTRKLDEQEEAIPQMPTTHKKSKAPLIVALLCGFAILAVGAVVLFEKMRKGEADGRLAIDSKTPQNAESVTDEDIDEGDGSGEYVFTPPEEDIEEILRGIVLEDPPEIDPDLVARSDYAEAQSLVDDEEYLAADRILQLIETDDISTSMVTKIRNLKAVVGEKKAEIKVISDRAGDLGKEFRTELARGDLEAAKVTLDSLRAFGKTANIPGLSTTIKACEAQLETAEEDRRKAATNVLTLPRKAVAQIARKEFDAAESNIDAYAKLVKSARQRETLSRLRSLLSRRFPTADSADSDIEAFVRLYYSATDLSSLFIGDWLTISGKPFDTSNGTLSKSAHQENVDKYYGRMLNIENRVTGGPNAHLGPNNTHSVDTNFTHTAKNPEKDQDYKLELSERLTVEQVGGGFTIRRVHETKRKEDEINAAVPEAVPARPVAVATPTVDQHRDNIRALIGQYVRAGNSGSRDDQSRFFASHITRYYDEYGVPRSLVARKNSEYYSQYPNRSLSLAGTPSVTEKGTGTWDVKFTVRFNNTDRNGKPHNGSSYNTARFRLLDGGYYITTFHND